MDEASSRLPTLETARLRLRGLRMGDAPEVLALFGDEEVVRYYDLPRFRTLAEAEDLVRDGAGGERMRWGITIPGEGDRVVGTVGLHGVGSKHRFVELGYAVLRERWGEGLAGEAVGRLVEHAFEDLGLHRVEAFVDPDNSPSVALLERQGFALEGRLRGRFWDGRAFQDDLLYARLSPLA